MIVTNNGLGISTPSDTQLSALSKRASAFGIKNQCIDGYDLQKTWKSLVEAFHYVREEQKPCVLEVSVPRLFGHSSSSGANRDPTLRCPIDLLADSAPFPKQVSPFIQQCRAEALLEFQEAVTQCEGEEVPDAQSVNHFAFV